MSRYEDLRAPVLARFGRDSAKNLLRFLGRVLVEQVDLEIGGLNSKLVSHFIAPQGDTSFGIGSLSLWFFLAGLVPRVPVPQAPGNKGNNCA